MQYYLIDNSTHKVMEIRSIFSINGKLKFTIGKTSIRKGNKWKKFPIKFCGSENEIYSVPNGYSLVPI